LIFFLSAIIPKKGPVIATRKPEREIVQPQYAWPSIIFWATEFTK
jgi:hypothetical protein